MNYITKEIDMDAVAEEIRHCNADIIGLNEVRDRGQSEEYQAQAELFSGELRSFPSDVPEIKIDYIFTSPDIKALAADIPADIVSDHRPHIAVIGRKMQEA